LNGLDLIVAAVRVFAVFGIVLLLMALLIWMERKGAAYIQDRRGPNRAHLFGMRLGGLVHIIADAIKLLTKEEVMPRCANRSLFVLAPMIAFCASIAAVATVPFTSTFDVGFGTMAIEVADLGSGLVFALAMSSLGIYAWVLAGWSSGSTYSLLGGMRAAAQLISYALALGLSATALFLVAGSLSLSDIVADQEGALWRWNALRQPFAFLIFTTALFAETGRLPFDLPEGEQEIVGFHVEYSSARFAMFSMAEYAHIVVGSSIIAALFLGGWSVPFVMDGKLALYARSVGLLLWPCISMVLSLAGLWIMGRRRRHFADRRDREPYIVGGVLLAGGIFLAALFAGYSGVASNLPAFGAISVAFLQLCVMFAKVLAVCALFIWVRWTLPRFRYDQLMAFGWKVLLPLAMLNVAVTAFAVMLADG
jgi:NADH-quinone oxidoreductase subunit H